jgi:hypothetical protein
VELRYFGGLSIDEAATARDEMQAVLDAPAQRANDWKLPQFPFLHSEGADAVLILNARTHAKGSVNNEAIIFGDGDCGSVSGSYTTGESGLQLH